MQTTCHLLLMLSALTAQPANREPVHNSLDFCKLTIIDEVNVPAEQEGVLVDLHVREGDLVEKGQFLGQIDDRDAKLAAEVAKYETEMAKKQADNKLDVQKQQKLSEYYYADYQLTIDANEKNKGTFSKTEVRRKRVQAEAADIEIKLAKHQLDVAQLDWRGKAMQLQRTQGMIERRKIISRINGVVADLHKHAGDWVQPGETVMRVVRMEMLRVEGFLDGTQYARHEVINRPVIIEVQLTGGGVERLEGTITFASPLVESNQYKVWADIGNRRVGGQWLLTPGLNAKMRLSNDGNVRNVIGR